MNIVPGVGLLLFEPYGTMLVLRELQSKPQYNKAAGMLSPPFETIEDGETPYEAVHRLIFEEIGRSLSQDPTFFREFRIPLSATHTVHLHMFTCFVLEHFVAEPRDTDIEYYGWLKPDQLLSLSACERRREVEPVLRSYLKAN